MIGLTAQADRCPQLLMVWAKDGSRQAYAFAKNPELTFSGTELLIQGETIEARYPLAELARFTYEVKEQTGITDVLTGEKQCELREGMLYFPDMKAQNSVRVYAADGHLVLDRRVSQDGPYSLSLQSLQPGVYLVRVNGFTTKISKR